MFRGNRIVRVVRGETLRNTSGGKVWVITAFWNKWADVDERRGSPDQTQEQTVYQYEQEIKIRYEPTRPTHSNDLIFYNGAYYKILSLRLQNEATVNFEIMRCEKSDQLINSLPPMNVNNIIVLNYFGTGSEGTDVTFTELIGKVPFDSSKDGATFEIIPNKDNSSTTPSGELKQVYINRATGETKWSQAILLNEQIIIQYYGV